MERGLHRKGGHWERVCQSRKVSEVIEDWGQEDDYYYMGSVNSMTSDKDNDEWTVTLNIDSSTVDSVLSGPGGGLNS